jgi:choline-glycine betaine transporter
LSKISFCLFSVQGHASVWEGNTYTASYASSAAEDYGLELTVFGGTAWLPEKAAMIVLAGSIQSNFIINHAESATYTDQQSSQTGNSFIKISKVCCSNHYLHSNN